MNAAQKYLLENNQVNKTQTMEHFFYGDKFYSDLEDLLEDENLELYKERIEDFPNDFSLQVEMSTLEPIVKLDADWIAKMICECNEDRFSEYNDEDETEEIFKAIKENIDFKKAQAKIPKLYYPNGKKHFLTKKDLLEQYSR